MSSYGLVCPECKQRLYTQPPTGPLRTFWESQPGACAPDGEPCFIYSLMWSDYRIRSLHAAEDEFDLRSLNVVQEEPAPIEDSEEFFDFEFDDDEFSGGWNEDD